MQPSLWMNLLPSVGFVSLAGPPQPPWNHFLYLWTFAGASSMYARLCLFGVGLKVRCEMWSQHIITMTQWQSLQRHRFAILRATPPAQGPSKKAWGSGIPSASLLAPQHMRTSQLQFFPVMKRTTGSICISQAAWNCTSFLTSVRGGGAGTCCTNYE